MESDIAPGRLPATKPARRSARERRWLVAALLLTAGLLGWSRWDSHREIDALERSRLAVQVRAVELNLARQFFSVRAALRDTRKDIAAWNELDREVRTRARLLALSEAMPGVDGIQWVDGKGQVRVSNLAGDTGRSHAQMAYFQAVRSHPDAAVFYLSPPFRSGADGYSMNLSVALFDDEGVFDGVLAATVDPDYFHTLLGSVLYARDMAASVVHADGTVLASSPQLAGAPSGAPGGGLAGPGSLFSTHLARGQEVSVLSGVPAAGAGPLLVALRTMRPPGLDMDQPLVLAVSRDVETVFSAWARQNAYLAPLYLALVVASWLALVGQQRRRRDVEQAVAAEAARTAAEAERLALALRGGDLALWDTHIPSGRGTMNERWYSMLGYTLADAGRADLAWESLVHPDDRDRVFAANEAHLLGRTPAYESQYRLRHRDGHWVWVLDRGCVVERDAQGAAVRMVGTHMDITSRVESEEALRRSEESLSTTLYSIGDAVIATDAQGLVTRMNATAERLTGWTAVQARGRALGSLFRILNARTREPMTDPVAQVLAQGDVVGLANDAVLVARDGSEHPISDSAAPIRTASGEIVGVVLVFSDISESHRMLQALRDRESQLARVTSVLPASVTRIDRERRYRFVNAAFCEWFQLDPLKVLGRTRAEVLGEGVADTLDPYIERALAGEILRFDAPVPTPGAHREAIMNLLPDRSEDGQVRGVFIVITDITDRKLAERELKQTEARLRMASRLARVGDWRYDARTEQLSFSPVADAAPLAEGLSPVVSAPLEISLLRLVPEHRARFRARLKQAVADGLPFEDEVEVQLAHGERRQLQVLGEAVHGGRDRVLALQGALRDVTAERRNHSERQALERQLREAQKIESIGTLAGGIAHDFNNILAAILGNVALARGDLPPEHGAQLSLEQIHKASLRARSLVQQILTFSRRQPNPLVVQPLRPVVEETLALLRATLPASVRVDTLLADEALWLRADATQIQQVLMNLCTNAWHALPEGRGRIEIGSDSLAADVAERQALAALLPDVQALGRGPLVHLWVRDNGSGMDATTRERIFDPFYTTKPVGQGTGLGLSVVHGIVRGHGGVVRVDSAPGQGSTFHLYFPMALAPGHEAPADAAEGHPYPEGRGQQLLYVDDDEVMRLMVQRLLERLGYRVSVCASAAQALELVRAQPQGFDLVISDYNMPETSGLELATQLLQQRADLPVIISSGFVTEALNAQVQASGVRALMNKEQTLDELPGLVQSLLHPAEVPAR